MKFVKPLVAIAVLSAIASPFFLSSAASAEIIIRPFARREVILAPRLGVVPVVPRSVIVESPSVVNPTWQSSESYNLNKRDGWVESNLAVNHDGRKLLLNVDGQAQFDYAEVKFGDGQVERVSLRNSTYSNGEYSIANFGRNRHVNSVRLLSRSESSRSHISLDLQS